MEWASLPIWFSDVPLNSRNCYQCIILSWKEKGKSVYFFWRQQYDLCKIVSAFPWNKVSVGGKNDVWQKQERRSTDMFRLWAKEFENNHMIKDLVIEDGSDDTRTHKVFRALDEICDQFDLGKPIWLDATVQDFKRHDKARFTQDNFIETIDFDYLEIHVIEED